MKKTLDRGYGKIEANKICYIDVNKSYEDGQYHLNIHTTNDFNEPLIICDLITESLDKVDAELESIYKQLDPQKTYYNKSKHFMVNVAKIDNYSISRHGEGVSVLKIYFLKTDEKFRFVGTRLVVDHAEKGLSKVFDKYEESLKNHTL